MTYGGWVDRRDDSCTVWTGSDGVDDGSLTNLSSESEGCVRGVGERTGGIAPRRCPGKEGGSSGPRRGTRLVMLLAAYLLLVGIPVGGFVTDSDDGREFFGNAGKMGHEVIAGKGLRDGRRNRNAVNMGQQSSKNPRSRRRAVKIVPACNWAGGRRVRWRRGKRGFGGRPRLNHALRGECWHIAEGLIGDVPQGRCGQPREEPAGDQSDHNQEGKGGGDQCDNPDETRRRRNMEGGGRGRPGHVKARGVPWLCRAILGAVICASAKGVEHQHLCGEPGLRHDLGEASGPPQSLAQELGIDQTGETVAWRARPELQSAIKYPSPRQTGFHGVHAAGHTVQKGKEDHLSLEAVTVNSSGWGPLKAFLQLTGAHVVFGQEHRLPAHEISAASAWARRHGWRSIWAPATKGPKGGWSAGTVILTRSFIGLRHPRCW